MPDASKNRAIWQWSVILEQLKYHGKYHPPKFSDPITQHLSRIQSWWYDLHDMTSDERPAMRHRWIKDFNIMVEIEQALGIVQIPEQVYNYLDSKH